MSTMQRVSKQQPCSVCGAPDWCLIGKSVLVCMRTLSPRPTNFKDGSVGYIHPKDGAVLTRPYKPERPPPTLNATECWNRWRSRTWNSPAGSLAEELGVSQSALDRLGACRAPYPQTWAFPMRNGQNAIVGLRLRNSSGKKWAERGSHQGLFLPQGDPEPTAYLVEGPTDTAAALTLGVFAIGRPSCNGGIFDLVQIIKLLNIRRAVIVADKDEDRERPDGSCYNPGVDGAKGLPDHLGIPNCTLLLPAKDMRSFVQEGGDRATLDYCLRQAVWRKAI